MTDSPGTSLPTDPAVLTRPIGRPTLTLGWHVIDWVDDHLVQPDGPNAGEPFRWTPEQVHFLLWWYAVNDQGRWLFPRAVLERMKGWGKDPVGAGLAAVELIGPCRPVITESGELVRYSLGGVTGQPHAAAWVQVAAVSKDQTRNTMTLFPSMFSAATIREYNLDIGKEIIYAKATNGRLEAVTSSPRSLEGGRATFVLRNETHHWLKNNDGHEMAQVIDRNVAKARGGGARVLDITNAHEPGEDSVAERVHDGWLKMQAGKTRGSGLMYDSRQAPASTRLADEASLRHGLVMARGDSTWLDVEGLIQAVYSPTTEPSQARRFYLNQRVAAEDAWVTPQEWDRGTVADQITAGEEITLGFDGSRTNDSTALVACRVSDGLIQLLGVWEKPQGPAGDGWVVARDAVAGAVDNAMETYKVLAFYSDVNEWESYVEKWSAEYGNKLIRKAAPRSAVGWDMRNNQNILVAAVEAFHAAITGDDCTHTDNPVLNQHVYNARRWPVRHGVTFRKEHRESNRKVDALAAAVLARMAWQDVLGSPEWRKRQTRNPGRGRVIVLA